MDPGEIVRRLSALRGDTTAAPSALKYEAVVDDVYDLAQKQLAAEDTQSAKLDARATSLFGAAGFSMTVAFSFGGWSLLDNTRKVPFGKEIASAFFVVLAIGLATSFYALRGLLLSPGQTFPDENDVFSEVVLDRKRSEYRSYVAAHIWAIWQNRHERNQRRAKLIIVGQRLFFAFLVAIMALSGVTTWSAIKRPQDPPTPPPVCSVTLAALPRSTTDAIGEALPALVPVPAESYAPTPAESTMSNSPKPPTQPATAPAQPAPSAAPAVAPAPAPIPVPGRGRVGVGEPPGKKK